MYYFTFKTPNIFLRIISLFLLILLLTSCNQEKDKMKWFTTKEAAINYGLHEENLNKENIIGELKCNNEIFVVFNSGGKDNNLIGLSNLAKKDNEFLWYRSNPYTKVDRDIKISFIAKTFSNKEFYFYTGKANGKTITIETNEGTVKPFVDENTQIYYYITEK